MVIGRLLNNNAQNDCILWYRLQQMRCLIATITNDSELKTKTAKDWSKLNNVTILPKHINCNGCRKDGAKTIFCSNLCPIRKCAIKHSVDNCTQCKKYNDCDTIQTFLKTNHSIINH